MILGKHINKYYLKFLPILLLGAIALIAVDLFQMKVPEAYRIVVNGLTYGVVDIDGETLPFNWDVALKNVFLPLLVVAGVMIVGRFTWRMCFLGTSARVEKSLRRSMFDKCKDLSANFYQTNKVGSLMSYFTNDIDTIQDCFGWGVMMLMDALFLGGLSIYKMASMDWKLALLSLIPVVFMLTSSIVVGVYLSKKWDERQEAFSKISDFAQESFSGFAVIKAFVKEAKELSAFKRLNKDNEKINVQFTKMSTLLNVSITLFVNSVVCIVLGYGGYLVYKGKFNAGQLVEFLGYFNAIVWPVLSISDLIDMHSRGKASLKRVGKLLDEQADVVDREGAEVIENVKGKIEFRDLTFRYPGANYDALSHVSFVINAGENVGIVGKTGSGKSTVAELLLRVFNVKDGTIFVDDKDVNDITIESLRNNFAYVPQDNFLFGDTIAENIAFASDSKDRESVVKYARLSDIDKDIEEFRERYDTMLGERGVTVSGGQKQRISIARAFMKEAAVTILDDSVSAVDTRTESIILGSIKSTRKGRTTILVSHRVLTVKDMDKIILLDEGKVIGVGTHEYLYENVEEYRNMVELQKLDDEKEEKGNE